MTAEVEEENDQIWKSLDDDEDGQINLPQLYSFLTRQGLNIQMEEECVVSPRHPLLQHLRCNDSKLLLSNHDDDLITTLFC